MEDITLSQFRNLLNNLGKDFSSPEISSGSDYISLEWYKNKAAQLSLEISCGRLLWAGIIGQEKTHGSCPFQEELPDSVMTMLAQIESTESLPTLSTPL